jgi:hypothetical protein
MPTSNSPVISPSPLADFPPIEVLANSDGFHSSDEDSAPIVSVDAFLRRAAFPSTKTYGKKTRRKDRGKQRDLTNPISDEAAEPETSITAHRPVNPIYCHSKPLKKRLLRAAVLSHTDPEDWLLQYDSVPQSRKPLPFVEERRQPHEPIQKRRTWSLVDPRKALAAGSNAFSTRNKALPRNTKRNTLSGWRATYGRIYLDGSTIQKRKFSEITPQAPLKCLPLSFVPLHEAEKRYSLMRLPQK